MEVYITAYGIGWCVGNELAHSVARDSRFLFIPFRQFRGKLIAEPLKLPDALFNRRKMLMSERQHVRARRFP